MDAAVSNISCRKNNNFVLIFLGYESNILATLVFIGGLERLANIFSSFFNLVSTILGRAYD
jgi:hypothetical protein